MILRGSREITGHSLSTSLCILGRVLLPERTAPKGGVRMKRVKAGCILQTLVFMQKEDCGFDKDSQLRYNREELERYRESLEKNGTRYQIIDITEQPDSSVIVRVRKHLNEHTDVSEYFN